MKIEFDKALLWLVPYLYLVSVMYYWGYWGTLGGDAVNYYPTSDFVKGIVNPVSYTTIYILFLSVLNGFFSTYRDKKITKWLSGLFLVIIGLLWLISDPDNSSDITLKKPDFIKWWRIAFPVLAIMVNSTIETKLGSDKKRNLDYAINFTVLSFLCLFPLQAHVDGRLQAWKIRHNQEYDYTVIDSVAAPKGIYKYLGKAGDHHFLMTLNNNEHVIVSEDKLSPLIIRHYDITDDDSKKRFIACEQKAKMSIQLKR